MFGAVELSLIASSTMFSIVYMAISLAYAAMAQNLEWCGNQRYNPNQVKNSHSGTGYDKAESKIVHLLRQQPSLPNP